MVRAAGASPCFRPSRSRTSTSGRSISRPTGAPMSLVRLHAPDFERFPRFREALAAAVSRRAGAGRRDLHTAAMVASRRVAGAIQHVGELLVARCSRHVPLGTALGFDSLIHAILTLRRCRLPRAPRGGQCSITTCSGTRPMSSRIYPHIDMAFSASCRMPMSRGCGPIWPSACANSGRCACHPVTEGLHHPLADARHAV